MKRVTGIGGIFFKANDPKALAAWYERHLGIEIEAESTSSTLRWRNYDNPEKPGATVWGTFPADTTYFGTPGSAFMVNYRVEDMDALLQALRAEGVEVVRDVEDTPYGRFAWIVDAEGNRIELWEAPENY